MSGSSALPWQTMRQKCSYKSSIRSPCGFKGRHTDGGKTFNDYVIRFGPGSLLKFGVAVDGTGKIASISLG